MFTGMSHPNGGSIMISISGATCAGKTTITKMIHTDIPHSILIHQDDYYLDEKYVPSVNGYKAWDNEEACDWPRLMMKIENALADPVNVCDQCKIGQKSTKHLVVLEGTQILRNSHILSNSSLLYFIEIEKDVCFERRRLRTDYTDPDEKFFHEHVWPQYLDTKKAVSGIKSVKKVDGLQPIKEIYDDISTDINSLILNQH